MTKSKTAPKATPKTRAKAKPKAKTKAAPRSIIKPKNMIDSHVRVSKTCAISDERVADAFLKCGFNKTKTARLLGISRSTFLRIVDERAHLQEMMWDVEQSQIEHVKDKLMDKINEGDIKAIIFYLERRSPDFQKTVAVTGTVKTISRVITTEMGDQEAAQVYKDILADLST